jgi:hypothetical protein
MPFHLPLRFFAMNIGASGAAASMGVAYGSGAVKKKTYALIICLYSCSPHSVFAMPFHLPLRKSSAVNAGEVHGSQHSACFLP